MTKVGPVPGVTSITKLQDSILGGDLAVWGANQAVDRILEGNVTRSTMRELATDRVRAASRRGTVVHAAIEQILAGATPEPTVETSPFIYSFSSWLAAERPEFLHVERRILNRAERFAGTFDAIAKIRGRVALLDVKTGKWKDSFVAQLAGYAAAEGMGTDESLTIDQYHRYFYDDEADLEPLPRIRDFYILLLRENGYELVPVKVTAADRAHFIGLVRAYHRIRAWADAHKNGVTHE